MNCNNELIVTGLRAYKTLQISQILAQAAIIHGLDSKTSEFTHESLTAPEIAHVRIGKKIYSPLVPKNRADILVCFEPAILKQSIIEYLTPGTVIVINSNPILSSVDSSKKNSFLSNALIRKIIELDIFQVAEEAGDVSKSNFVMLGILSNLMSSFLSFSNIVQAIEEAIETKEVESCLRVLEAGRQVQES